MQKKSPKTESQILWANAKFLGIDLVKYYIEFGEKVSEILDSEYKNKTFSIICGLGNNGSDGLAVGYYLAERGHNVTIYLVGRSNNFESDVSVRIFDEIKKQNLSNLKIKQECYADDIVLSDVIIEALVGEGLEGDKLNKRFKDIINRITHFKSKLIALDVPAPHYNPHQTFSINYPKVSNAEVIKINYPAELESFCGPGEFEALNKPNTKTHKNKNGRVLFLGENNFANKSNIDFEIFRFRESLENIEKYKILKSYELERVIDSSDTIVLGDINEDLISFSVINHILKTFINKKYILFGSSLEIAELSKLQDVNDIALIIENKDLTKLLEHDSKKYRIENENLLEGKLKRFAIENKMNVALIGTQLRLFSKDGKVKMVRPKHLFEKDFKLDFASKVAEFSAMNDLWLSLRAGCY